MFNGATILLTIISLITVAIVWRIEYERQEMRRDYCKHCNERIIYRNGHWQAKAQINPHMNMGNPSQCINELGHQPR